MSEDYREAFERRASNMGYDLHNKDGVYTNINTIELFLGYQMCNQDHIENVPKHETVEQWEARKLPDRSRRCIVWRYGEAPREMLFNHHGSWQVVGDYETFHCSHFTHWLYMPLSPNHHGKPGATT